MAWWPRSRPAGRPAARPRLSPRAACLILGGAAALLVWGLGALGTTERLELKGLDLLFLLRGPRPPESPVVLVAVDYESLQVLGDPPWPREQHARLLERLREARVVGLDLLFDRPSDPRQDRALAAAARAAQNVVWAAHFTTARESRFLLQHLSPPIEPLLQAVPHFGFVDITPDRDNTVRRSTPVKVHHGDVFRSFALKVVEQYTGRSPLEMTPAGLRLLLRGRRVPLDEENATLIHFLGPPGTFPRFPYHRVLQGDVPPASFRDKIVLVGLGTMALGGQDHFPVPFSGSIPGQYELMPGLEIHANIVDTYLNARPLQRAGLFLRIVALLAIGLGVGCTMGPLRPLRGALGSLGIGLAFSTGAVALFVVRGVWFPLATPLLLVAVAVGATALYRFMGEERMKEVAARSLERYVSRDVAQEILARGEEVALGGTRRRVTVLFTDIRGFTALSERLRPEEVVDLLNAFFTRLSPSILRHGGTLDKYMGDALMAFWGAPLARGDDALRAVRAGLEMLREAGALSGEVEARYGARLEIGIGISTGEAVVGNIGSPDRMGYTAIGDTVNVASRLQDLTKEYGSPLLVGHSTYDEVKHDVRAERVGFIPVKGRAEPIGAYRVLGEKVVPSPAADLRLSA